MAIFDLFCDFKFNHEKKQEFAAHLLVLNSIIIRYKRIILAYINYRLDKIEDSFWKYGNLTKD